jgi:hypothetical protein
MKKGDIIKDKISNKLKLPIDKFEVTFNGKKISNNEKCKKEHQNKNFISSLTQVCGDKVMFDITVKVGERIRKSGCWRLREGRDINDKLLSDRITERKRMVL